jgi:hypothetical protein
MVAVRLEGGPDSGKLLQLKAPKERILIPHGGGENTGRFLIGVYVKTGEFALLGEPIYQYTESC